MTESKCVVDLLLIFLLLTIMCICYGWEPKGHQTHTRTLNNNNNSRIRNISSSNSSGISNSSKFYSHAISKMSWLQAQPHLYVKDIDEVVAGSKIDRITHEINRKVINFHMFIIFLCNQKRWYSSTVLMTCGLKKKTKQTETNPFGMFVWNFLDKN